METLIWILAGGLLMSAVALLGAVTFALSDAVRARLVLPLVAFSAGSLLGGAFFHMIPEAIERSGHGLQPYVWILVGFAGFFALEQFLHWHHHWHSDADRPSPPLTTLIVIGDGLHNFLGGVAVGAAFLTDVTLGISTWLAAAAHEVPQELGKYGVLLHGGWSRGRALLVNWLASLTFLVGGVFAYAVSFRIDVDFLVPFAAGNFLYIAASDLVPEVNRHHEWSTNLVHFVAFAVGAGLLLLLRVYLGH